MRRSFIFLGLIIGLAAAAQGFGMGSAAAENRISLNDQDVLVLDAGPIHEAFAQAVLLDPEPGMIVSEKPPALIEEIPPEHKPDKNAVWISGYWAWDDERGFIWVSGIWRVPPPGRRWVPGFWSPVTQGHQWIPGFWAEIAPGTAYLPEPPGSIEAGPSSLAPSPEHLWIPGCWIRQYGGYVWRPGYWRMMPPDRVWVPAYYIRTPRGYVYVTGYWDYTVTCRGVLFSPVYVPPRTRGFSYRYIPRYRIDLNIFWGDLFLRRGCFHYYFGDYYAAGHAHRHFTPWHTLHLQRRVYVPILAHHKRHHPSNRHLLERASNRGHGKLDSVRAVTPKHRDSFLRKAYKQKVQESYNPKHKAGRHEIELRHRAVPGLENRRPGKTETLKRRPEAHLRSDKEKRPIARKHHSYTEYGKRTGKTGGEQRGIADRTPVTRKHAFKKTKSESHADKIIKTNRANVKENLIRRKLPASRKKESRLEGGRLHYGKQAVPTRK
ncbi:MAG: hypothetical protein R6U50_12695 [Desulfobacterales bacterium]